MAKKKPSLGNDLFQAILDDPENDAPRLIYADWLEENGDPARAEFIRVQCEMARLDEYDPQRIDFRCRADVLLRKHRKEWTKGIPKHINKYRFERGFLYHIRMPLSRFLSSARSIFRKFPTVQSLGTYKIDGRVEALANLPESSRLRELQLGTSDAPDEVFRSEDHISLHKSPYLLNLRALDLCNCKLDDMDVAQLRNCRGTLGVQRLGLGSNGISKYGIQILAAWDQLLTTTHLDLRQNAFGNEGIAELVDSDRISNLVSLELGWQWSLHDLENLATVANSPNLTKLRRLQWEGSSALSGDGLLAVLNAPGLSNMVHLGFFRSRFGIGAAKALAACPNTNRLRELNLDQCGVTNQEMEFLAESRYLSNLTVLSLDNNYHSSLTGTKVISHGAFSNLRELRLQRSHMRDADVEALVNSPVVAQLRSLDLNGIHISAYKTASAFLESEYLSNLVELKVNANHFTSTVQKALFDQFGYGLELE